MTGHKGLPKGAFGPLAAGRSGRAMMAALLGLGLSGCATVERLNPFGGPEARSEARSEAQAEGATGTGTGAGTGTGTAATAEPREETIWDLFASRGDAATTIRVNRYIWIAALDVLAFLPVEAVDPFSGVILTGFGTPPGGSRAYRATVHVSDPALDARSLRLALTGRDGQPADAATLRAVEDAILTRARELRTRDAKL